MTIKNAFTHDEWQRVGSAPFLVAMYVVASSLSGPIGIVREMLAAEKAVTLEAAQPDGLPLVKEIEADLVAGTLARDLGVIDGAAEAQARVLRDLDRAVTLVDTKASGVASAFRSWLYSVAGQVARAAREGEHLGGKRVSADERVALQQIAVLLGVSR